ncbi:MAG: hypothetical protein HY714_00125 [Candidatus Omnitrophica bacterium]|nr:hypothetical protein [Candidatus Omnitrophota bacterium]
MKSVAAVFFLLALCLEPLWAAAVASSHPLDLPPIRESKAYRSFIRRRPSEISRLVYLIDRYKGAPLRVIYDGAPYENEVAVKVARWFLPRYYNNEKAEEWIVRYCSTSFLLDNPIYVEYPDGRRVLARKILLEELQALAEAAGGEAR